MLQRGKRDDAVERVVVAELVSPEPTPVRASLSRKLLVKRRAGVLLRVHHTENRVHTLLVVEVAQSLLVVLQVVVPTDLVLVGPKEGLEGHG